jgi:hypothetical protein
VAISKVYCQKLQEVASTKWKLSRHSKRERKISVCEERKGRQIELKNMCSLLLKKIRVEVV